MNLPTTTINSVNVEFYAFRIKYEDNSIPPYEFFSSLIREDIADTWDVDMPTPGSVMMNIIKRKLFNKEGVNILTGVLVEATPLQTNIELIDITGKIENAELKFSSDSEEEIKVETDEGGTKKALFKFKRWRIGILPEKGIVVIERRAIGYEKKLAEYFSSWMHKWVDKVPGRNYKSIKVDPFLTGAAPSDLLSFGSIGVIEFAISSDILATKDNFFSNDITEMLKKDKNLVVSIEFKAKKGQAFLPQMTSSLVEIIKAHEQDIEKCSSRRVVSSRKTKPIDLINNLKHKACTVKEDNDENVLKCVEDYIIEINEDEKDS